MDTSRPNNLTKVTRGAIGGTRTSAQEGGEKEEDERKEEAGLGQGLVGTTSLFEGKQGLFCPRPMGLHGEALELHHAEPSTPESESPVTVEAGLGILAPGEERGGEQASLVMGQVVGWGRCR